MKVFTTTFFAILLFILNSCSSGQTNYDYPTGYVEEPAIKSNRFEYNDKPIIITKHAACRMRCRKITKDEIIEVINEGKINHRKSKPADGPNRCPTTALEDWSYDNQEIRIVLAECDHNVKLVTVIDLNMEKSEELCSCK